MTLEQAIKHLDEIITDKNNEIQDLQRQSNNNFDTLYNKTKYLPTEKIDELLEQDAQTIHKIGICKACLEEHIQLREWLIELQQRRKNVGE